ncbi:MAG: N-acetylglucosamine-6-phosphate deacetylase [Acidobacteriota bacterium]
MNQVSLVGAGAVLPIYLEAEVSVHIDNGVIQSISPTIEIQGEPVDISGTTLFPGFIDIHNHGAVGVDVNTASAEDLLRVAAFLARQGVTSWMPTLVPDSNENYWRVIGEIDRLMELQTGRPVAQAVGVHYEGVFASEKMCGALRPEYFKTFTGTELNDLPRLKTGVHMTTFAPEVEGGIALVHELVRQGWIASIGHTRADPATLDAAFAAGARHMTHFFNAMTGLHHRDIGVVGWGLANDGVTFDIIADGVHVDPRILGVACRAKTPAMVSLISDSVAPTGLGDGEFELWGERVSVRNGRTQNERGSIAGSVSTMLDGVRMLRSLGFSDADAALMAATNPARLLGIDDLTGSIEVGKLADLVALDDHGNVRMTVVRGQIAEN